MNSGLETETHYRRKKYKTESFQQFKDEPI